MMQISRRVGVIETITDKFRIFFLEFSSMK